MAGSLIVEHDGRRLIFDGSRPVLIGRDVSNDIVCENPAVSRVHLRIELDSGVWKATDESSLGTFADKERVRTLKVERPVTLRLGDVVEGEAVRLLIEDPFARPTPLEHGTVLVPKALAEDVDLLTVVAGGVETHARSGQVLAIGRDATSDVCVDDPIVSRRHARVSQRGERWTIEDVGSSRGTFIEGKRIDQADLVGTTEVRLGDPEGPAVTFRVGTGEKTKRTRNLGWLKYAIPAAVVVVLLGVIGGYVFTREETTSLANAKKASVFLEVSYENEPTVYGSGTLVSKDGLILTSAHIAARDAPGLGAIYPPGDKRGSPAGAVEAKNIIVSTYVSDTYMSRHYTAEVQKADGYLDLAVIKINGTVNGDTVNTKTLNLAHVVLGDSDDVQAGDEAKVLGFPNANSSIKAVSVGVGAESMDSSVVDDLVPGPPGWLRGSGLVKVTESSAGGALVTPGGEQIGITGKTTRASSQVSYRPINLAKPLITAAEGDPDSYPSAKYVRRAQTNSTFTFAGTGTKPVCGPGAAMPFVARTAGVPYVYLNYKNVDVGQAVYVSMSFEQDGTEVSGSWKLWDKSGDPPSPDGCAAWRMNVAAGGLKDLEKATLYVRVSQGPGGKDADHDRAFPPKKLLLVPMKPPDG